MPGVRCLCLWKQPPKRLDLFNPWQRQAYSRTIGLSTSGNTCPQVLNVLYTLTVKSLPQSEETAKCLEASEIEAVRSRTSTLRG